MSRVLAWMDADRFNGWHVLGALVAALVIGHLP